MRPKKPKTWLAPLVCYGLAVLFYVAACGLNLLLNEMHQKEGLLPTKELDFESFYAEGVILRENPEGGFDLVSTDPDPKLIYSPGEPFYLSRFTFRAETANKPGGEMVLYYTTKPGQAFSENRRVAASRGPDGSWFFDLSGREVTALRFDPDNTGGVLWRNWSIVLNEPKPLADYFLPDAREAFLLLFLPGFTAAAVLEAGRLIKDFALRHKAKEKPKKAKG